MNTDIRRGTLQPVLATDLDGTLIPLEGNPRNRRDLQVIARHVERREIALVYVTGRHLDLVSQAIAEHDLPRPDWIICDVGTSIYGRSTSGQLEQLADYQQQLDQIIAPLPIARLREHLSDMAGLRLQEAEKQGRFKLSYYAHRDELERLVAEIDRRLDELQAPYSIVPSVDPFTDDGLIDLLPRDVSKAHALHWWTRHAGWADQAVVYAGDTANDWAALVAGYLTILVGNADRRLARQVYDQHRRRGWMNRLYLAQGTATSGVLEGCRWFERIPPAADDGPPDPASEGTLGATALSAHRTHFRVWAPRRRTVAVEDQADGATRRRSLDRDEQGYFSGTLTDFEPGDRYRYVLDGGVARPDPASRYQPEGVHGPSQVVHAHGFAWQDEAWRGVAKEDLILYELHLGAFTQDGTFAAAIARLAELQQLGVTAIELMPVAQSPGRWNWGYDGVDLFAVRNTYGTPDDFKAFVDACHARGMAVILDVVYNHLGPEGNYLAEFGDYFSSRHHTPWGEAWDYDGPNARHVRRFVVENALYWLREYHLDGLRLDAVHFMLDDSQWTVLDEIREAVWQYAARAGRQVHLIAEANIFDRDLLTAKSASRPAYDATWCDDIMHSLYSVVLPGLRLSCRQYTGWDDLVESLRHGFVYCHAGGGARRVMGDQRHELTGNDRSYLASLVVALQTHDVVGNHPQGQRLHQLTSPDLHKATAALLLLYPSIPLIFMGDECAAASPFLFFADFEDPRLREAVDQGRLREYPHHDWQGATLPHDPAAFDRCKCLPQNHHGMRPWYQALIGLRRQWQSDRVLDPAAMAVDHWPEARVIVLRYQAPGSSPRFVAARFPSAGRPEPQVSLQLDGEVLLNSTGEQWMPSVGPLTLAPCQALAGEGTVRPIVAVRSANK